MSDSRLDENYDENYDESMEDFVEDESEYDDRILHDDGSRYWYYVELINGSCRYIETWFDGPGMAALCSEGGAFVAVRQLVPQIAKAGPKGAEMSVSTIEQAVPFLAFADHGKRTYFSAAHILTIKRIDTEAAPWKEIERTVLNESNIVLPKADLSRIDIPGANRFNPGSNGRKK